MRVGAAVDGLEQGYSPSRQAGDPVPSRPRTEHEAAIRRGDARRESYGPRPKTELRRVTVCEHDERLQVKSVRGIGFSWRCTCGAKGKVWQTRSAALWGMREHEEKHR